MILDATCVPGDLRYPQDLSILNQARTQSEKILDCLHRQAQVRQLPKPRTYRKKARREYLKVARQRRPSQKVRANAIRKQLQYLKRNLGNIDQFIASGVVLTSLSPQKYKKKLDGVLSRIGSRGSNISYPCQSSLV